MDTDALVDRITQEVLQVYNARKKGGAASAHSHSASAEPLGDYPLVGVCGNPATHQDAVTVFGQMRAATPRIKALLTPQAEKLFSGAKRAFGGFALDTNARDYSETLGRFSHLVILNTSVTFVSKLALLIVDGPLHAAVFEFLDAGKPVVLTAGGLQPYLKNPAIRARVEEYLGILQSYGIRIASGHSADGAPLSSSIAGGPPPGLKKSECSPCTSQGHCASHCEPRIDDAVKAGACRVSASLGLSATSEKLGRMIDHTLLKPDATDDEIKKLCDDAAKYCFASVCVNPSKVRLASDLLRGSGVMVCTVVGFPLGATTTVTKEMETRDAIANGADEIDMVINVGALKAKQFDKVREDIAAVVRAAGGHTVKVILETSLLNDEEKVRACQLSKEAGAHFVKTSTGFGSGGATTHDIELMRRTVGPDMGVKASGGVRDYDTAQKMVDAGATRIGASASVAIVSNPTKKAEGKGNY